MIDTLLNIFLVFMGLLMSVKVFSATTSVERVARPFGVFTGCSCILTGICCLTLLGVRIML